MASRRQSKNVFDFVVVDGVSVGKPRMVRQVMFMHFKDLYSEAWRGRPKLEGPFTTIGWGGASAELVAEFTVEEVWATVTECDGNKALGPDGFNLACIQKNWKVMKDELVGFRPISLVNSIYKILAKVLSRRLKKVIPTVINEAQTVFIGGRCILDVVMIANEVIEWWKCLKHKGAILKLDFEKEYDFVNWDFLFSMLCNFGFDEKWICWIKEWLTDLCFG
ncbi:uncharacterized protein LOC114313893 [Camellia sinensis]|uniref:uncharacterized protein LOC114313893 n=1 Tax=Camellia sinensis TaxID=4442 RepID=UPI0010364AFD|nr:uncharacterized protein LOC114313893 [Camellia sinensis]